jgi:hypothetical protein
MLVNEHTLSAGEMVAAFAQENGLAESSAPAPAAKFWEAATSVSAKASCFDSRLPLGTRGKAQLSKAEAYHPMWRYRCQRSDFARETITNWRER